MTSPSALIIGHRGASAHLPENTLAAFDMAFETCHADMIEFDVRLSKDGIPVIIHDETLDRTTNGSGGVGDYSLNELLKLDAGYWFDPQRNKAFPYRGQGIRIPTLEDVFTRFPDKQLAVEIKDVTEEIVKKVLGLIRKHQAEARTIVGSLEHTVFRLLETQSQDIRIFTSRKRVLQLIAEFYLLRRNPKKEPLLVASLPVKNRFFDLKIKHWIDWLHEKNITVYYWTVNDAALMQTLAGRGADGLMADDPGLLRQVLSRDGGTVPTNG